VPPKGNAFTLSIFTEEELKISDACLVAPREVFFIVLKEFIHPNRYKEAKRDTQRLQRSQQLKQDDAKNQTPH
jgi:hypothetical protein